MKEVGPQRKEIRKEMSMAGNMYRAIVLGEVG